MPWATVAGNVRLPLDLGGLNRKEAEERAARAIKRVGLGFEKSYPRELSGGMKMRAFHRTRHRVEAEAPS